MPSEVMDCLGKDNEVISLLRHLPYPEDRPCSERPDCLSNRFRFYDWKTTADKLKDEEYAEESVLFVTEGDVHQFGMRNPKHCVGLMDAITEREEAIENVMLLDVEDGRVYWMDCPKHVLDACEPKTLYHVYDKGEAVGDEKVNNTDPREEGESDDELSDDETLENEASDNTASKDETVIGETKRLQHLMTIATRMRSTSTEKKKAMEKKCTTVLATATSNGDPAGGFATSSLCLKIIS